MRGFIRHFFHICRKAAFLSDCLPVKKAYGPLLYETTFVSLTGIAFRVRKSVAGGGFVVGPDGIRVQRRTFLSRKSPVPPASLVLNSGKTDLFSSFVFWTGVEPFPPDPVLLLLRKNGFSPWRYPTHPPPPDSILELKKLKTFILRHKYRNYKPDTCKEN